MNARFKPAGGGKPEFLHTLNGSGPCGWSLFDRGAGKRSERGWLGYLARRVAQLSWRQNHDQRSRYPDLDLFFFSQISAPQAKNF